MPNETEIRERRQQAILAILGHSLVRRQSELVSRLRYHGFEVTQSSVSRDLRELGVAKLAGRYIVPRPRPEDDSALDEIVRNLRAVRPAGPHLTVVVTREGAAQAVGLALDRAGWPELVGTVAGDDTLFVATAGAHEQTRLLHRLQTLLSAVSETAR